jgi:sulfatase maturation enzyme AslB (radical SAM superfamily)
MRFLSYLIIEKHLFWLYNYNMRKRQVKYAHMRNTKTLPSRLSRKNGGNHIHRGCNFRCPFCHNALLVTGVAGAPVFSEEEIIEFLSRRKGKLDGVCITGGEPLLQTDLKALSDAYAAWVFLLSWTPTEYIRTDLSG